MNRNQKIEMARYAKLLSAAYAARSRGRMSHDSHTAAVRMIKRHTDGLGISWSSILIHQCESEVA